MHERKCPGPGQINAKTGLKLQTAPVMKELLEVNKFGRIK